MNRTLLAAVLVLARFAGGVAARDDAGAAVEPADRPVAVADLIAALGHDEYPVRRRAEEQLLRAGPEAFDQIKAAEESADLEIAERARYILQRMRVEWIRPQDSAEVRRALARYEDLAPAEKIKRFARLAELEQGEGLPALCRVARLERAPQTAREAAVAVLAIEKPAAPSPQVAEACLAELGASSRAPVEWLRLWLAEFADRRAAIAEWDAALDAEAALLDAQSPETTYELVYVLMIRRLEASHELGLLDETTAALMRIVDVWDAAGEDHDPQRREISLAWALRWIIQAKRWDVLEQFVARERDALVAERGLLYYLAGATALAGRQPEADGLADRAFAMDPGSAEEQIVQATILWQHMGQTDWAEREYRRSLQGVPVISIESILAREKWSAMLHDRLDHQPAAELLDEFFQELDGDRAARRRLLQLLRGRNFVDIDTVKGLMHYYRACHFEARREYQRQRAELDAAWQADSDNPDILIAMHRLAEVDDSYRQQTRGRLQEMSQKLLGQIEQYPDDPGLRNKWAWLVSNTEGDFAKAVEFSQRSLELEPDEPSYLDTLGRCHFSAGELEQAVTTQRRAVELAPHYAIMRRQLDEFERALELRNRNPK